jgi:hypothetical protein
MPNFATGINRFYLLDYLENISQLSIGNDLDVDDISQDLVIQFIKEGYQRIISLDGRWPWLQSVYTFSTVANQRSYSTGFTLTSTNSTAITVPQTNQSLPQIREVINLVNNTNAGNELIYIDQFKAEAIWNGTSDQPNIPTYWSLWSGQINLWPKPLQVYDITIRAYREPNLEWLNEGDANSTAFVDLNQEFHMMLVNFVMMRIFQFQEDPEMAAVYQRHFQEGVAIAKDNITAPNSNQPILLSGGLQLNGAANVAYGRGGWGPGILVSPGSPYPLGFPI